MFTRLLACCLVLVSCGGGADDHEPGDADPIVGADCLDDGDCEALCARGDRFPGGMCTLPCHTDEDCPTDSSCIADEGGVCAFSCDGDAYCRTALDENYECKDRDDLSGHERRVCVGD